MSRKSRTQEVETDYKSALPLWDRSQKLEAGTSTISYLRRQLIRRIRQRADTRSDSYIKIQELI